MKPFQECPVCGGEMVQKEVEKLLRGGSHTAAVKVSAEVCLRCGERLYSVDTAERFDQIRSKLRLGETESFQAVGQAFEVAD